LEIIVDDLNQFCCRAKDEESVLPDIVALTYSGWVGALENWKQHPELSKTAPRWGQYSARPATCSVTSAKMPVVVQTATLTEPQTSKLLSVASQVLGVTPEALLSGVFANLLSRWSGSPEVQFDMERHGRDALKERDASGVVGWFTSLFPVTVLPGTGDSLISAIGSADHALRNLPDSGAGFGILRYLQHDDEDQARNDFPPNARWCLNFLGIHRNACDEGPYFRIASRSIGEDVSPANRDPHELVVEAFVENGRLTILCRDGRTPSVAGPLDFATAFIESLLELVDSHEHLANVFGRAMPESTHHVQVGLQELLSELER
jgi:non-ribosomal peptide synthase protein (TIGR01720 family)